MVQFDPLRGKLEPHITQKEEPPDSTNQLILTSGWQYATAHHSHQERMRETWRKDERFGVKKSIFSSVEIYPLTPHIDHTVQKM